MRLFTLLLLIAALDGAFLAIINWRWIEPALKPATDVSCPSAVTDALRQAHDALAARKLSQEHAALVCLFQAVSVAAMSSTTEAPTPSHVIVFDQAFTDLKAKAP